MEPDFQKCWADWRCLILAAINSFASLLLPIAPRDILGINWSLLLSCLLGFRICICICILLVQIILSFFFNRSSSFRWKDRMGGRNGRVWRNLGCYLPLLFLILSKLVILKMYVKMGLFPFLVECSFLMMRSSWRLEWEFRPIPFYLKMKFWLFGQKARLKLFPCVPTRHLLTYGWQNCSG